MNSVSETDFLALGKSARTAYIYAKLVARAERFLAKRGKTLLDCDAVDVAQLADTVRKSHSSRGQLRAALVAVASIPRCKSRRA